MPRLPSPRTPPPMATPDMTPRMSSRRVEPPPLPRRPQPSALPSSADAAARRERAERRARAALEDPPLSMTHRPPWTEADDSSSSLPSRHPPLRAQHSAVAEIMSAAVPVGPVEPSPESLLAVGENLSTEQLTAVIARLNQKLQEKEGSERRVETDLLLDFLKHTKLEKVRTIETLRGEVSLLEADVHEAERQKAKLRPEMSSTTSSVLDKREGAQREERDQPPPPTRPEDIELGKKRKRMQNNYDVLQEHYFQTVARHSGEARKRALRTFSDDIFKLTQYSRLRDRATLMHVARVPDAPCSDVFKASNIISSIEFDRESEFLATAGVTKRIKIFEFSNIERNRVDVHYPVREIPTSAKLSWVCWNPYIRHHLVSSDYEGFVTLWDVNRGVSIREYEEHENRAWSVDYCPTQPTLFASGSDDGRVKLWHTSQSGSLLTIDNRPANVCSVKFHPREANKIAFGSVDFKIHYYDLRNPSEELHVFESHTRAVSYVKFMSPTELVTASVDSTIKLWDLKTMSLARTFSGHVNDKNFVGLSVTPDYIACGSEENTAYCYYKAIPKPFTGYRFSTVDPLTGEETHDDDDSQFVSSVCWCPKNPELLVAANSLGALKVLALEELEGGSARHTSR